MATTCANTIPLFFLSATAAYVEFVQSAFTVFETSGFNGIALKRSGHLQASTSVECRMRGVTASGGSNLFADDFFIAPIVVKVVFSPGQTDQSESTIRDAVPMCVWCECMRV